MKFEDVKVGQILEDKIGNKYEVMRIVDSNKIYPVFLKCIEFRKAVTIDSYTTVTGIWQTFWIIRDRSMLLSIDNGPGKFIKENFYSSLALSNGLQSITITASVGTERTYILARSSTIAQIQLTLSGLEAISDDYLSLNNIRTGMKVVDGAGNEYVVVDHNAVSVKLLRKIQITTIGGTSKTIETVVRVPYWNHSSDDGPCTTKDFKIVKD